jgi:predicted Ser/Thr protein kinase
LIRQLKRLRQIEESHMKKGKLFIAGIAAFLLGVPLAEQAKASGAADVVFTALEAAFAITVSAIEAS